MNLILLYRDYDSDKQYIACQGPLEDTMSRFLGYDYSI